MNVYDHDDFTKNEAWLIFRLDTQVNDQPVDVYTVMDAYSGYLFDPEVSTGEGLDAETVSELMARCRKKARRLPGRLLLIEDDPASTAFSAFADKHRVGVEFVTASQVDALVEEVRKSWGQAFYSPSTLAHSGLRDDTDRLDREAAKHFIPDSYDACPCASGKKYKFCCKPILRQITEAMVAAEEGRKTEALSWIEKARAVVGNTAEVLCREAIVWSFFDKDKSEDLLAKCFASFPGHPRTNYSRGLNLKESGKLEDAIRAYETAIANYPETDRYHLNETYNNLASAFYEIGEIAKAKEAWEKALVLLPSDRTTRENLVECIYGNPEIPPPLRQIGPSVRQFFLE